MDLVQEFPEDQSGRFQIPESCVQLLAVTHRLVVSAASQSHHMIAYEERYQELKWLMSVGYR